MINNSKKRSKIVVAMGILSLIICALGLYIIMSNRGEETIKYHTADNEMPTLPTVSFQVEGTIVNTLVPYTSEMDITAARESITPLDPSGNIEIQINDYGRKINHFDYEVTSLDGMTVLTNGKVTDFNNSISLNLDAAATNSEETVLKISLMVDQQPVYFYTRLISYNKLMLGENLKLVEQIHKATFDREQLVYLEKIFTSTANAKADLSVTTMKSNALSVAWGGMDVEVIGEVKWTLTDTTSVFTTSQLSYYVRVNNGDEFYAVDEYYRTSYSSANKQVELKDFRREITQILDMKKVYQEKGELVLGVANDDVQFIESENQNYIAFTQAKELFVYNIGNNNLTKIYSALPPFDVEEHDPREFTKEYDVEILDVDDEGNVNYSIYGYNNAGPKEGKVGTTLYVYDNQQNVSIERAFIEGSKAYSIGREELRDSVHYSKSANEIYLLANQIIYSIDLQSLKHTQISQKLETEEYCFDKKGDFIAFNSGEGDVKSEVTVLNIESGETFVHTAKEEEHIYPLGFLDRDMILGYAKKADKMPDYRGREITPAYAIEIKNQNNQIIKSYVNQGVYIESVNIENRVVYLTQVAKKEDIYTLVEGDYIANNLEEEKSDAQISTRVDDDKGVVKVLKYSLVPESELSTTVGSMGLDGNEVTISYPSHETEARYYVYARGDMVGTYSNLADAIILADNEYGAVIDNHQQYLWRRGARSLTYDNYWLETRVRSRIKQGEEIIEVINNLAPNNVHIYTGTTVENMCYLIENDQVIGVRLNSGEWVVLVGYDNAKVYYINSNGDKKSSSMKQMDANIQAIIGSSKF